MAGTDRESGRRRTVVAGLLGFALTVSTQGAEPAAGLTAARLKQLVADLQADDFATRQAASRTLQGADVHAVPHLAELARQTDLEGSHRVVRVLQSIALREDWDQARGAYDALESLTQSDRRSLRPLAQAALRFCDDQVRAVFARRGVRTDSLASGYLTLADSAAVDDDLRWLRRMPQIQTLTLTDSQITDAGLAHLRGHPGLLRMNLFQSQITDAGLPVLLELPALREVHAGYTKITDEGLRTLGRLKDLEYVGVRGNKVSDAGVAHLKNLTNLRGIYLGETPVTDAALDHLLGMSQLTRIYLQETQITDDGLLKLAALANLQRIDAWNTRVTPAGAAALREKLPDVEVELVAPNRPASP